MASFLHLALFACLSVALTGNLIGGRSVLLRRLIERENDEDDSYYRRLAAFVQLEKRNLLKPNLNANKFLERFGYLQEVPPGVSHDHASRSNAIRNFQKMYNLRETGVLNEETMTAMAAPRCGMPDTRPTTYTEPTSSDLIKKRYFVPGYKWQKKDLTYHFRNFARSATLDPDTQKRAIERAFKMWSDVSSLTFRETQEPRGNLNIEFSVAAHSDGPQNSFDGPGGVLAHAFYPENGETHFDDQEIWVDRQTEGIDLMTVAAHELGHALGLGHSPVPGALMAPYYQGYDPEFVLTDDDISAIQSLYGPKQTGDPQPAVTRKPTTPAPPTSTTTARTVAPAVTKSDGRPDSCSVNFRAVTQIHDGSIMVFNGPWLWRLTGAGLEPGYPVQVRDLYRSAPSNVDAAIYSRTTYYTYLFYGKTVWQYHGFDLIKGQNVGTQTFSGSLTDAVMDASGNIILIKGNDCWSFDEYHLAVHTSRPCSQVFPQLTTAIDSAVQLITEPDFIYLFKAQRYLKYNIRTQSMEAGYPKMKAGPWMGSACGGIPNSPK